MIEYIDGTIYDKGGIYHAILTYKDENGKRRQKWKNTHLKTKGNKKRAETILEDFEKEFLDTIAELKNQTKQDNKENPKEKVYFFDHMLNWLEQAKINIDQTTYISYESNVLGRIKEYFQPKKILLEDLTAKDIRGFYTWIRNDGCSGNTAIHFHASFTSALKMAMIDELIESNPMEKVERPKKEKFIPKFYSENEIAELISVIKNNPKMCAVILVCVFYGLRVSEAVGLRKSAIDFLNKTITINHVVIENKKDYSNPIKKDKTKNSSSYRTFPLVPFVEEALIEHLNWIENNKKIAKGSYYYGDDEYIFLNEIGHLLHTSYVSKEFKKILAKNGLKIIRFHDLRHSSASLLLSLDRSMSEIQAWLGHASYSTTANVYAHLDVTNAKKESANTMSNAFEKIKNNNKKELLQTTDL